VHQCNRQVPRRMQNSQTQCACEDNVAGGYGAAFPQHDSPRQQSYRQNNCDGSMPDSKPFKIEQARAAGPPFAPHHPFQPSRPPPKNDNTSGIFEMTSTISPSTAAALLAKS